MHYLDEGSGPVVIMLHGNPTWCFFYRNLIKRLKDTHRVIVPDFIGMGLSERPKHVHFRASHRIQHLNEFVDALGLDRYSMIMHDWGGSIGTGHAVRHVERIERLVYLNTTLTETESLPPLIKCAAKPVLGKFLTRHTARFLRFTTKQKLGVSRKLSKDVVSGYYYPYRTRQLRNAIWDFVADIPFDSRHPSYADMLDLARMIPKLAEIPVQLVWGLRDPCFHREMLTKVAEHFPHADILELPHASHLVLEDAADEAGECIEQFLSGAQTAERVASAPVEQNALYQALLQQVKERPLADAVVVPSFLGDSVKYAKLSYQDLYTLLNKYQRGLADLGLARGDTVLMLVSPGADFLALAYAVMGRGAIPVFLDPGMGREKLIQCIKEIKPDAFLGSPKAQILRWLKKELFTCCRFHLTAAEWYGIGGPDISVLKRFAARPLPEVSSTGTALIAFTSGGTGTPKGVLFTDAMIRSQLDIFKTVFGLEAGKKDLPLLPIFSLFNLACGVGSVFPPMDVSKPLAVEPQRITRIISDHQINYSFGSPTLWKKIAEYCVRSRQLLTSLEKVFIAGAPVPRATLEMLKGQLPNGDVFTPYGATESLPVTFISANEILAHTDEPARTGEQGTFVGKPCPGLRLAVIKSVPGAIASYDDVIQCAPYEIGEVIVSGSNVSPAYFERPDATTHGKVPDNVGGFWHRMGDMGYCDAEGNLYFCGRQAHIVQLADRIFYSVPIERVFNTHEKVARSALVSLGDGVGIVIEPNPQHWPQSASERENFIAELLNLARSNPLTAGIDRFFFHESFPVDGRHNAKIFRDQLGSWAREQYHLKSAA